MRYLGLIFNKDDDSGIAQITVTDTYTSLNLVSETVDLFQKDQVASAGKFEEFIFWVRLPYPENDRYQWIVEHSGSNNPLAVGPNYAINFNGYLVSEELAPASIKKTVVLIDKTQNMEYVFEEEGVQYVEAEYRYDVNTEITKQLFIRKTFSGAGLDLFKIGDETLFCAKFMRFSLDGGTTWRYPFDIYITWGSNSPDYDNETINAEGEFWLQLLEPLVEGQSIVIDVLPVFEYARIELRIDQPHGEDYVDVCMPVAVMDYVAEFKKGVRYE